MRKYRNFLFYTTALSLFSFIIYLTIKKGNLLEQEKTVNLISNVPTISAWNQFKDNLLENISHPLSILLLQIVTIIIISRIFGFFCKKIGQPSVIGEIIAGIFLGPSFVGMYFPEFSTFIFPTASLGNLQFLSQIGLILFMFVIGMELDLKVLKNKAQDAVVISHSSIITPFTLGIVLAYFVYYEFAPKDVHFLSFSLFIGISMSITAFPVLARIVQERGLSKTRLGSIAITCAAADDITAWCLLAVVIAIVKAGSILSALYTVLLAVTYVIIMVKLVQPFFKKIGEKHYDKESLNKPIIAIFFITLIISSFITEIIGIHALFGAFMAGVIMPSSVKFRSVFIEKVEDVSLVLLLPLFFVYTGLRTQIGLLNTLELWYTCVLIIGVAIAGKFLGGALSAKFIGQSWKNSLSIGALMNTRGLMELIVLNIGYDLGILDAEIFAMLVIMALVTTFMTGPALDLINKLFKEKGVVYFISNIQKKVKYNILISFSNPDKGNSLLKLVDALIPKSRKNTHVTLLHLSPNEINQYSIQEYEENSFASVKDKAEILNIPVSTIFKSSFQIETDISKIANSHHFSLLLVEIGNSIYEGSLLGKFLGFTSKIINPDRIMETISKKDSPFDVFIFDEKVNNILKSTKIPVGIYLNKNTEFTNIFIPVLSIFDSFLLIYAQRFIINNNSKITILDIAGIVSQHTEFKETIEYMEQTLPDTISVYDGKEITPNFLASQGLLLTSVESWKRLIDSEISWLSKIPSSLIIRP